MGAMPRAWQPAGKFRQLRLRMGYTQRELSEKSGVSVRTIRDLESGRVRRPQAESLIRLAAALGDQAALGEPAGAGKDVAPARPDRPGVTVQILGPVLLRRDGRAHGVDSSLLRSLLALLALGHGGAVTQEAIIDALWGDRPPRSARSLVHVYIGQLRRLLEPGLPQSIVDRCGGGYRLMIEPDRIDAARFDDVVADARRARREGDHTAAAGLFESALQLWTGPVAADAGPRMQSHPAAVALAGSRVTVALEWADLEIDAGRGGTLAPYLRALAQEQPLHEGVHARLMLALARAGDQAAALRVFADLRDRLAQELGLQPGDELQDAHLRVLRQQHGGRLASWEQHPAQLPSAVPAFAGRRAEIAALDELPTAPGIVILSGTAGVGKTALALHWAHQARDRFSDGQLFVDLQGFPPAGLPMAPTTALRHFLDALGVAAQRIPAAPQAQGSLYRSLLSDRRMLVVLDNANDAEQVRPLLPGPGASVALVTSRSQLTGLVAAEGAHLLPVEPLPADHAHELLARRIPAHRLATEGEAVESIIRGCAGLPLALVIIAARAATNPHCTLASVAEDLGDSGTTLDALAGADPRTDIRTVFGRSYQALDPEPRRLFRLLGLHPGPDITIPAAASLAGLSPPQVRALIGTLCEAHLVREHAPGRYSSHDLVRAYAAELAASPADSEQDRAEALRRALDHYAHSACAAARRLYPQRDPIDLLPSRPGVVPEQYATDPAAAAWFVAEHQVLLCTVQLANRIGAHAHTGQLAWALTDYFETHGYRHDWIATEQLALDSAERRGDLRSRAFACRGLARAQTQLGRYDNAQQHLKQALDLLGELHDGVGQAYVHNSLAILTGRQGQDRDALGYAEHSLRLFEAHEHLAGQARAHNTVGWFHAQLGEYDHAIDHCERALALHEKLGNRHGAAATLDSIGYARQRQGDVPRAIECFERALELVIDAQTDRLASATMLTHLGDAHEAAGNLAASRAALRQALDIYRDLGYDLATLPENVRSAR